VENLIITAVSVYSSDTYLGGV